MLKRLPSGQRVSVLQRMQQISGACVPGLAGGGHPTCPIPTTAAWKRASWAGSPRSPCGSWKRALPCEGCSEDSEGLEVMLLSVGRYFGRAAFWCSWVDLGIKYNQALDSLQTQEEGTLACSSVAVMAKALLMEKASNVNGQELGPGLGKQTPFAHVRCATELVLPVACDLLRVASFTCNSRPATRSVAICITSPAPLTWHLVRTTMCIILYDTVITHNPHTLADDACNLHCNSYVLLCANEPTRMMNMLNARTG